MRTLLSVLALVLTCTPAAPAGAQVAPRYSEVRIRLADERDLGRLVALGIGLDEHSRARPDARGQVLTTVVNEVERAILETGPFPFEVTVEDVAAAFAARPGLAPAQRGAIERGSPVQGFDFGTMAGFYRLGEMVAELDSMAVLYPHLATTRVSIGTSGEGRDIWMLKISDNPGIDEEEPEVLYTGVHHAREPQSMMTVIYFMYHLLEGYGVDPEVTELVNGREFYFIPMVNPDGYVYNEATNPDGGGMWRKTRRDNGDGSFGVDPNRNYGYNWGFDDAGSSPEGWSEIYRGPAAWSEPEIAAMRDFAEARQIRGAIHFHSHGELYLYPWGYQEGAYTPDDAQFFSTSAQMAAANGYTYGASPDVLYRTNGGANDWFYGEQSTKPKAFSWTAEVATEFWPEMSQIFPVAQENVHAAIVVAQLAGTVVAGEPGPGAGPGIAISPNPATNVLHVAFEAAAGPAVIVVHDALGRAVIRSIVPTSIAGPREHTINVSSLAPGRYFVSATDAEERRVAMPFTRVR